MPSLGRKPTYKNRRQLLVSIEADLLQRFRELTKENGVEQSFIVSELIKNYLEVTKLKKVYKK